MTDKCSECEELNARAGMDICDECFSDFMVDMAGGDSKVKLCQRLLDMIEKDPFVTVASIKSFIKSVKAKEALKDIRKADAA